MSDLDDYQTPEGYGSTVGKCLTHEEVEALLAAERERCAKVAASFEVGPWWRETDIPPAIAAAIRSLALQTTVGER